MKTKIDSLLKKRERIEKQIEAVQAAEKRKNEILKMEEFIKISALPDDVLRAAFKEIATQNA